MTEEKLPPAQGEEPNDPDTNTDDQIDSLEIEAAELQPAIPVAEAAPPAAPPAAPAGPRVFPQHYTLLFGAVIVFVAASSVWERAHVFGAEVSGPDMISGAFLLAMALYIGIVGILNILQGRLRGMFAVFVAGAASLYFGIKAYMRTINADNFLSRKEITDQITHLETQNDVIAYWIGQFGPGVWLSLFGGVVIVLIFLKAIFGGGKKKEPPKPARSSRGRR